MAWKIFVIAVVLMGWIWMWGLGGFILGLGSIIAAICYIGIPGLCCAVLLYWTITGK